MAGTRNVALCESSAFVVTNSLFLFFFLFLSGDRQSENQKKKKEAMGEKKSREI